MALVSVIIINYNNKNYLNRCIDSILNQTYKNIEIIFIDNKSNDLSYDYVIEEYSDKEINFIRNEVNNGYAGGANQGIKISKGEYVVILNPDIIMEYNFIEELVNYIKDDNKIGAISGKLLKYDFNKDIKTKYIDSAGIEMYRSGKSKDRGQNELDTGAYDNIEEVFGICGAAPMYRKSALQEIKINEEYFDEDFFSYKEDIDISWRLNLYDYKNIYYPRAVAYHGRGFGSSKGGAKEFINARKRQSEFLRGLSYRNQRMMEWKNIDKLDVNIFFRLRRRVIFAVYALMFERFQMKYYFQSKKLKKKMIIKHNIIKNNRKRSNKEISYLIK
jgi:GT2 family glycosyltransferase